MTAPDEIWKEIRPGVEVSSLGRVRTYVTGHPNSDGYLCLSGGARGKTRVAIHRLVAEAFLGPCPAGLVIRHRNDQRTDNRACNLVYGSRAENYEDACANGIIDRYCPERIARLRKAASSGGKWWKGKKRSGLRGKAVSA